jgi:hypothetical protein
MPASQRFHLKEDDRQPLAHISTAAEISQINPCLPGGPLQVPPFFLLAPGKDEDLNITTNSGLPKILNQPVKIKQRKTMIHSGSRQIDHKPENQTAFNVAQGDLHQIAGLIVAQFSRGYHLQHNGLGIMQDLCFHDYLGAEKAPPTAGKEKGLVQPAADGTGATCSPHSSAAPMKR